MGIEKIVETVRRSVLPAVVVLGLTMPLYSCPGEETRQVKKGTPTREVYRDPNGYGAFIRERKADGTVQETWLCGWDKKKPASPDGNYSKQKQETYNVNPTLDASLE